MKSIGCPSGVTVTGETYSKLQIKKGSSWERFPLPKVSVLDDKPIIGLYIRKQSDKEKKKLAPFTNTPLVANGALVNAYINIKVDGCEHFRCVPLETFLFDCSLHSPGSMKDLYFGNGIDMDQSEIIINTACLDADIECLMFHWVCTNKEASRFTSTCNS